jgi:hypothetical protein
MSREYAAKDGLKLEADCPQTACEEGALSKRGKGKAADLDAVQIFLGLVDARGIIVSAPSSVDAHAISAPVHFLRNIVKMLAHTGRVGNENLAENKQRSAVGSRAMLK